MEQKKSSFSSKIGFVLAAAGSAVGLGNIWRFPYLAAKYGGGIFLLCYILLAVTFGFSMLVAEIAIGRKTGKSVIGAYTAANRHFAPLGILAALVPIIITPYYCVIGGWVLKYTTAFIVGTDTAADGYFGGFIGTVAQPTIFFVIYMALTALVVLFGVEKGIEKVSKFLMPVLVVMIIGIAIFTVTREGALVGVEYYLKPDFSKFSIKTIVAAMGQLFYSLSLAMGIMVTYGSYMRKSDNIESCVWQIEVFDSGIAILAGLTIVPSVFIFSNGDASALNAGPSLMFITLPKVFASMPGGRIVGIVFFLLVALAALTSSISLMETVTHIFMEKFKLSRTVSCVLVFVISFALGLLSIFGYSIMSDVTLFGMQFLDFFDFVSNNLMMPVVALLTCVLVGYVAKTKYVEEEVEAEGHKFKTVHLFRIMIKFIAPVCLVVIFLSSIFGYV